MRFSAGIKIASSGDSTRWGYWMHALRERGVVLITVNDGLIDWSDLAVEVQAVVLCGDLTHPKFRVFWIALPTERAGGGDLVGQFSARVSVTPLPRASSMVEPQHG